MALEKIEQVKGKAVFVPGNDIDTDRIIPARFMVCVTFEGLGKYAFYDERKNPDGTDKKHPLTDPRGKTPKSCSRAKISAAGSRASTLRSRSGTTGSGRLSPKASRKYFSATPRPSESRACARPRATSQKSGSS